MPASGCYGSSPDEVTVGNNWKVITSQMSAELELNYIDVVIGRRVSNVDIAMLLA